MTPNLSPRQQKYFATLKAGLERDTGKTLDEWAKIARKCPETKSRERIRWLKERFGFTANRASIILSAAFAEESPGWGDPDALIDALWSDAELRAIYARIDATAMKLKGALRTARKGYTAYAREFQFAAARPVKGAVRLGLAIDPEASMRLQPAKKNEGWSARLKSSLILTRPSDVDAEIKSLLKNAADAS